MRGLTRNFNSRWNEPTLSTHDASGKKTQTETRCSFFCTSRKFRSSEDLNSRGDPRKTQRFQKLITFPCTSKKVCSRAERYLWTRGRVSRKFVETRGNPAKENFPFSGIRPNSQLQNLVKSGGKKILGCLRSFGPRRECVSKGKRKLNISTFKSYKITVRCMLFVCAIYRAVRESSKFLESQCGRVSSACGNERDVDWNQPRSLSFLIAVSSIFPLVQSRNVQKRSSWDTFPKNPRFLSRSRKGEVRFQPFGVYPGWSGFSPEFRQKKLSPRAIFLRESELSATNRAKVINFRKLSAFRGSPCISWIIFFHSKLVHPFRIESHFKMLGSENWMESPSKPARCSQNEWLHRPQGRSLKIFWILPRSSLEDIPKDDKIPP